MSAVMSYGGSYGARTTWRDGRAAARASKISMPLSRRLLLRKGAGHPRPSVPGPTRHSSQQPGAGRFVHFGSDLISERILAPRAGRFRCNAAQCGIAGGKAFNPGAGSPCCPLKMNAFTQVGCDQSGQSGTRIVASAQWQYRRFAGAIKNLDGGPRNFGLTHFEASSYFAVTDVSCRVSAPTTAHFQDQPAHLQHSMRGPAGARFRTLIPFERQSE